MKGTTTIAVTTPGGARQVIDQPYCWCCPRIIAGLQARGWPSFAGARFRPKLHRGRRIQWVVWDLHRGVIARQLGRHQALAIYWADQFNQDQHPRSAVLAPPHAA